jgi:hypothetical protein
VRLRGRKRAVLEAFLESPTCELTTAQLCQPQVGGARFGARLHELEHDFGCVFDKRSLRPGSWLYKLTSWPPELVEVGALHQSIPGADPGGTTPALPGGRDTEGDSAGANIPPGAGGALFGTEVGRAPAHDRELEAA